MELETFSLQKILGTQNVAEILSEKDRTAISRQVMTEYNLDEGSRSEWKRRVGTSIKLALQISERKTEPWAGASNVKFPLMTVAAMQFQSRAYPALVTKPDLVKCRVMGEDPTGQESQRAQRTEDFMSYQLLEEDADWESDTDQLLLQLPIVGCMFRKTYFDSYTGRNRSDVLLPDDFCISYYAKSIQKASHYTILRHFSFDEVESRIRGGEWLDVKLAPPGNPPEGIKEENLEKRGFNAPAPSAEGSDRYSQRIVLEHYSRFDLDGDGYAEPYICTVDKADQKLLRMACNFTQDRIHRDNQAEINSVRNQLSQLVKNPPQGTTPEEIQQDGITKQAYIQALLQQLDILAKRGKILEIEPIEYVTKYPFIPSPDGGFYDIGFGQLLGPLNDAVDTIINQLIDSGTLANSNTGFIASNARVRGGDLKFRPFEMKRIDVPAGMLKEGIMPLEVNPPSPVLFQLLELLVRQAQEMASITEVMTGQLPGQNTKATVAQQALNQGMKVFSGILQRLYRAFSEEYRKLYKLNRLYLDPKNYFETLGIPLSFPIYQEDFLGNPKSVIPSADPNLGSDADRLQQAMFLSQRAQQVPGYNQSAVEQRILQLMKVPNIAEIYSGAPPPPNPELHLKIAEQQRKVTEAQTKMQVLSLEAAGRIKALEVQMWKDLAEIKARGDEGAARKVELEIAHFQAIHEALASMRQHALQEAQLQQQAQQQQAQQQQAQQQLEMQLQQAAGPQQE